MNGFLLDTNVLSEFSRSTVPPHPNVKRWVETANPDLLFTSVLCLGEIRKGIELLDPGRRRKELEAWIDGGLNQWFGSNLLPITKPISDRWGKFAAWSEQLGKPMGNIDGLLAATAFEHDLTVVTRNTKHFKDFVVHILDPWENLSR